MFRNTFPMRDYCIIQPRRPGVRCTTSVLVWTSCTRFLQENAAIGLVVLQSAKILGLIICLAMSSTSLPCWVLAQWPLSSPALAFFFCCPGLGTGFSGFLVTAALSPGPLFLSDLSDFRLINLISTQKMKGEKRNKEKDHYGETLSKITHPTISRTTNSAMTAPVKRPPKKVPTATSVVRGFDIIDII